MTIGRLAGVFRSASSRSEYWAMSPTVTAQWHPRSFKNYQYVSLISLVEFVALSPRFVAFDHRASNDSHGLPQISTDVPRHQLHIGTTHAPESIVHSLPAHLRADRESIALASPPYSYPLPPQFTGRHSHHPAAPIGLRGHTGEPMRKRSAPCTPI
ncbi:uncharacterized protein SCHCODRAFT_02125205 [Schizophyllum commune H4-8]|uniref:uncharacterized protein n=1 Tax=Schizophyllum commune (strain H4-8 / FGSC 9210) TaxID=578458 RepID=UPI002160C84E|nr:uncharacterized protein SCHCODRAFT_02125205 [Schizophyllum commune H4-8]KAI5885320.1 hypothetical protein SCHCODRAFT_02125205 [Schizophyllum commune H4-8]